MRFTDSYGEQSCTAGRSSFITGQSVYRTGLSKVGIPGADIGLQRRGPDDRRAAQAARVCDRQFGKNHLGDKNKFLPTAHGFDEFFGNLYHLNAEEEPERPNWPSTEDFPRFNEHWPGREASCTPGRPTRTTTPGGPLRAGRQAARSRTPAR